MKSREIRKFRKTYTDYKKKCLFEGYRLAVLFDEKDLVKRMGGRWDAEEQTWWMPAKNLKNDAEQYGGPPNGSLVEDYLNDMQMVMGQYGELKQENALDRDHYTEYGLHKSNNEPQFKVQFYYEQDVVVFVPTGMGDLETEYLTVEEGRKRWDNLIECGYNRVENS
jgi:hypothetical protein